MIKISNIHKQFETDKVVTKVLHGITFEIKEGEFVSLMGPSGSGKSTLMHILGFLDKPSSGDYFFEGVNSANFDENKLAELRNKKIGFVFQAFNLLARTTVLNNVILPLEYNNVENKEAAAEKALKAVGLEHRLRHLSNQLSGGEKQRVAIARALVNNPKIIFADEPTGNLDSKSGQQVMQILEELNEKGKTIILVTHEQYTAAVAKRIIKLKDGKVISDKKVEKRADIKNGLVK